MSVSDPGKPDHTAKVVVVTGAGSGIGKATSLGLAEDGWNVVAGDIDEGRLAWTGGHPAVVPCVMDVSLEDGNRRLVDTALTAWGRVDAAALCAAVFGAQPIDAPDSVELFDRTLAVNLRGCMLGIRTVLPELRRAGGGAIVAVSSLGGLRGDSGYWAYSASKFGIVGLVKCLAREVGWENIRINAVCPGPTASTGLTLPVERELPELFESIGRMVPLQRWSQPDEQAAAIRFLLSPAASYINGVALPVDGGTSAGQGIMGPARAERRADVHRHDRNLQSE